MADEDKNGYKLSRMWFNYSFENTDKVSPVHNALFLWLCELNNRLGWVNKFAAPASMSMSAIGIKTYKTYKKAFDDLVTWDFVHIIEKSKNQHTANIISLNFAMVKNTKALDSAIVKMSKADTKADTKAEPIYINKEPLNLLLCQMLSALTTFLLMILILYLLNYGSNVIITEWQRILNLQSCKKQNREFGQMKCD